MDSSFTRKEEANLTEYSDRFDSLLSKRYDLSGGL